MLTCRRLSNVAVAAALLLGAANSFGQTVIPFGDPGAPKNVTVLIVKSSESGWSLTLLEGTVIVLERGDSKWVSTPIIIKDDKASCSFQNVPPEEYTLKVALLRMTTHIRIPRAVTSKLSLQMLIGGGAITIRVEREDRL